MLGIAKRIHGLSAYTKIPLIFALMMSCQVLWAAQDAIVIVERAVIYADKTMSAPVGYVPKGRRVTIGEIARNKSQVYPIVVSGKVAYIRTIDVNTEIEDLASNRLVSERFLKASKPKIQSLYTTSVFTYPTQISMDSKVYRLQNQDAFTFNGVQIAGSAKTSAFFDFGIIGAYAEGKEGIESFRMAEIGPQFSFRIIPGNRFILRWENQILGIPFASYSLGEKARVNGYGFAAGTGLNANFVFGDHWGMEVYGGLQYTKLAGFTLPDPRNATSTTKYPDIKLNPSFLGTRLGLGGTYQF